MVSSRLVPRLDRLCIFKRTVAGIMQPGSGTVIYTIKVRNQNSVKNYHETKRNTSQIKISFAHKFTSKMRQVCIIQVVRLAANGREVGSVAWTVGRTVRSLGRYGG